MNRSNFLNRGGGDVFDRVAELTSALLPGRRDDDPVKRDRRDGEFEVYLCGSACRHGELARDRPVPDEDRAQGIRSGRNVGDDETPLRIRELSEVRVLDQDLRPGERVHRASVGDDAAHGGAFLGARRRGGGEQHQHQTGLAKAEHGAASLRESGCGSLRTRCHAGRHGWRRCRCTRPAPGGEGCRIGDSVTSESIPCVVFTSQ